MKRAALFAAWSFLEPHSAAHAEEIYIRLQSYVEIPPAMFREAKATAGDVLLTAGVRARWAECSPKEEPAPPNPLCGRPVTPLDLQLRIIGKEMAKRAGRNSSCMGYALLSGEFSSIAAAYFHRAAELDGGDPSRRGVILGGIFAHEIGHLLGTAGHSKTGVMRASWSDADLMDLAKGRLRFTADQARKIAAGAARRARAAEPRLFTTP
ncbi:MAG: hypothetical protein KIT09_11610 [Bryobacteraceae bacterium]|nr:hypothetical protein [Bryobacteraceae bacterium]